MAEIDLKEGAEWKLAQEIIAAYAKGDGNSVRDKQTTEGKDLCDYLVTIPWLKAAKISAPRDLRKMKAGFLGFRAEEHQLFVTFEIGGSKHSGRLTFFDENGLKFHDIFLDQSSSYLSGKDVIGEKVESIRENAKKLVSDPSQWRDGNKGLVEFRDVSTQLGLQDVDEVAAFEKAAEDMIVFSTTWRQQTTITLDQFFSKQEREEKFIKALAEFSAGGDGTKTRSNSTAKIEGGASSVSGTASSRRDEIQNIINELSSPQADDFKKLFSSLNAAHKKLLKYLSGIAPRLGSKP